MQTPPHAPRCEENNDNGRPPARASFPFVALASFERWQLKEAINPFQLAPLVFLAASSCVACCFSSPRQAPHWDLAPLEVAEQHFLFPIPGSLHMD